MCCLRASSRWGKEHPGYPLEDPTQERDPPAKVYHNCEKRASFNRLGEDNPAYSYERRGAYGGPLNPSPSSPRRQTHIRKNPKWADFCRSICNPQRASSSSKSLLAKLGKYFSGMPPLVIPNWNLPNPFPVYKLERRVSDDKKIKQLLRKSA